MTVFPVYPQILINTFFFQFDQIKAFAKLEHLTELNFYYDSYTQSPIKKARLIFIPLKSIKIVHIYDNGSNFVEPPIGMFPNLEQLVISWNNSSSARIREYANKFGLTVKVIPPLIKVANSLLGHRAEHYIKWSGN